MGRAGSGNGLSEQAVDARPRPAAALPMIVIVEQRARLSREYSHVLDYLGLRLHHVRSADELEATLGTETPMAIICELAAGSDGGKMLHAISEFARHLPVLIVMDDDTSPPGVMDATIRFLRIADVTTLSGKPALGDIVEFLCRAGRKSGEFRVLAV